MTRLSEDEVIARFFRPLAGDGAMGLQDDCALIPRDDAALVVSTDMLVAGVHFFPDDPADLIARKALRVNLSDLVAKGAMPLSYSLSLALTDDTDAAWLEAFSDGLAMDQQAFGLRLSGGDTVRTPGPLSLSITAFGAASAHYPRRGGAKAGDVIAVTGTIGDAAFGLMLRSAARQGELASTAAALGLTQADAKSLIDRYLVPQPRLAFVAACGAAIRASMDISDGLVLDLARMAGAAGLSSILDAASVPLSVATAKAVQQAPERLTQVLTGGDDYELLLAVAPGAWDAAQREAKRLQLPLTRIGAFMEGEGGVTVRDGQGAPIPIFNGGHQHF
ncbi:MAG: thiamine-phosphate kinase [Pseudomonadota bacterium]